MNDFKNIQYYLEIYEPESFYDPIASFQASSPFQTVSVGDILNPRGWDNNQYEMLDHCVLEVIKVEHHIWTVESHIGHKVCVFTRKVPDKAESRI